MPVEVLGDDSIATLQDLVRGAESSVPVEVLGITDATQITAGSSHTCALRQTGTITCWGSNRAGQLGNGQSGKDADSSVPVEVTGITDATQITAGGGDYSHTCALRQTGTITCWGSNRAGQLGNGQSGKDADSSVPVEVTGITDATQITAGSSHTCALRQTGTITCWGSNRAGQLGNGQSGKDADSSVPVEVTGITDATQITAGSSHTCALHQDGTITCWGRSNYEVQGIIDATQITAGSSHTCALRQTGTITCWGRNGAGQLGNGQSRYGDDDVPSEKVDVLGITDAIQITAGSSHTCALRQTGNITCWGLNRAGQLGNGQRDYGRFCALYQDGTTTCRGSIPVEVLGITDATQITAGSGDFGDHTCALRQTGTITCWGRNFYGRLGKGQNRNNVVSSAPVTVQGITDAKAITTVSNYTCALRLTDTIKCWSNFITGPSAPVEVLGITDAIQITAGGSHTCALRQTGNITCWGLNRAGQLGNGQSGYDAESWVAVEVLGITDATQITAGSSHTCALLQTGTITCWGYNSYGQLGNGQSTGDPRDDSADSSVPVETQGITDATQITAGSSHTCALRQTGTITCWGSNRAGQLGNGQSGKDADSSVPVEVTGITDATQITAGGGDYSHTCALRQTGTITCWGSNRAGQLGNGQSGKDADSSVPVEVTGITDATQITASYSHTCALRQTGTITCWGRGSSVPVEVLNITDATAIIKVSSHTCALRQTGTITCWRYNHYRASQIGITDATQITTGFNYTCALRQTGTITCWGGNRSGQLGNGTRDDSSVPVQVSSITDATAIATGEQHSCALRQTGTITCWGNNRSGQLGNGTTDSSSVPVEVTGINDATAITAGNDHTCALRQTGTITCWGDNYDGQLGNGAFLPQDVVGFGG